MKSIRAVSRMREILIADEATDVWTILVASQFRRKWMHGTQCPEVRAIYKIVSTTANLAGYEQYLSVSLVIDSSLTLIDAHGYSDQVEAKGKFALQGMPRGNENRRWHGTTRKCKIGDTGVTRLCSDPSCSLCCIMRTSFDLSFFAAKTKWGRFGAGIYTSSTSSKFVHEFFKRVTTIV